MHSTEKGNDMFQRIYLAIVLTLCAFLAAGCATTRSTAQGGDASSQTQKMYPVSAEKADRILIQAMTYQFPDASVLRVELPHKGYFVTRRFALDSHEFTARMIPAKGIDETGKTVDGYIFEVFDEGSMLISGSVRASSLFSKIIENANGEAKPLPIAR